MPPGRTSVGTPPVVLFGACDRHNFGDLLFPHLAIASLGLAPDAVLVAGLVDRDLRPSGGHRVHALHRLAREGRLEGARLLHVGGEILDCTAREAAVMTVPTADADALLAVLAEDRREDVDRWAAERLGTSSPLPYLITRGPGLPFATVVVDAVGGVAVDALPPSTRRWLAAALHEADSLAVRDTTTLRHLQAAGLVPALAPDPAERTADLLGETLRSRHGEAPVAELRAAHPDGWIAVQLAAELGDDATLAALAAGLASIAGETGLSVVTFIAGTAPWHDDPAVQRRLGNHLTARLHATRVAHLDSDHVLDTCALLASSRACVASSLHAGIVAGAFARPVVRLSGQRGRGGIAKTAAYAATWERGIVDVVTAGGVAPALRRALSLDPGLLVRRAMERARAAASQSGRVRSALLRDTVT